MDPVPYTGEAHAGGDGLIWLAAACVAVALAVFVWNQFFRGRKDRWW